MAFPDSLIASEQAHKQENPINAIHIPFARHRATGRLLDVSEVTHGTAGDLECPACGLPVLEHQGEAPDCYFTHASEPTSDQDTSTCDHSAFVAIRRMAQQLMREIDTIRFPCAPGETELQHRKVNIDDRKVDVEYHGVPVDAILSVQSATLVLFFTHPSRPVPSELYDLDGDHIAALEIRLGVLPRYYDQSLIKQDGQWLTQDALRAWLESGVESKAWVYHPSQRSR